jgi:lysozyme
MTSPVTQTSPSQRDTFGLVYGVHSVNDAGVKQIAKFESFSPTIYRDSAGNQTIGYGHLITVSDGSIYDNGITQDQALKLLHADISTAEKSVNNLVKVPLNQNQFNALVSLVFNIGSGNFAKSSILRELNRGNYRQAASDFALYNRADHKINIGLIKRRDIEASIFTQSINRR